MKLVIAGLLALVFTNLANAQEWVIVRSTIIQEESSAGTVLWFVARPRTPLRVLTREAFAFAVGSNLVVTHNKALNLNGVLTIHGQVAEIVFTSGDLVFIGVAETLTVPAYNFANTKFIVAGKWKIRYKDLLSDRGDFTGRLQGNKVQAALEKTLSNCNGEQFKLSEYVYRVHGILDEKCRKENEKKK
ncbi:MAG TPA: hypothetical protein VEA59_04315 [Patescibacteria group bacterium]|nr:hypothetical protein [Patescibacteria group bacterium]